MTAKQPPKECNICHSPIEGAFVDGKTIYGPWADMCMTCHGMVGVGLGTGMGQKYEAPTWEKVAG